MRRVRGVAAFVGFVLILGLHASVSLAQPTWEQLQAAYAYDHSLPLEPVAEEPVDLGVFTAQTVRFKSVNDQTVPCTVCKPKNVEKPPVILSLHGLGGSRQDVLRIAAPLLCPLGVAIVGIDAQLHGDRKVEGQKILSGGVDATTGAFRQTIIDNMRAVDYIQSREDLDAERVSLLGVSMGGIMGSIVAALDTRIKAACLVVAGGDLVTMFARTAIGDAEEMRAAIGDIGQFRASLAIIEPLNFVGHISPRPLFMVNGRTDKIVPPECGQALFAAAGEPKSIVWYESDNMMGHIPPLDVLLKQVTEFLKSQNLMPEPAAAAGN
ncbi:MAG: alpha/beta hydrolase [Armatimonadetes bacterium]|nr:alpha/beta hydrolase [Armatimonadota bacterium]